MAVKADYYKLLGLQHGASEQEVKDAVRKSMREWRKRTEASDLAVRQEAELKVALIEEARRVLADPSARQKYDHQIQLEGVASAPEAQSGRQSRDWIEQANHYLSIGDYHSAAYAAREATHQQGASAESWWIRSRANAGLERFEDALFEAQQSVALEERNAAYRFHLGSVAESLKRHDQAISEYRVAAQLDPSESKYPLAIASVLLDNNHTADAIKIIEPVYFANTQDRTANLYLGRALIQTATRVPVRRNSESYTVTSKLELDQMRELVGKAKSLACPPQELIPAIADMEKHLDELESKRFHMPFGGAKHKGAAMSAVYAIASIGVLLFLSMISVTAGSGRGFLMFLIFASSGIGLFFLTYVPYWKVNARLVG